jgi:hypothetical protein
MPGANGFMPGGYGLMLCWGGIGAGSGGRANGSCTRVSVVSD